MSFFNAERGSGVIFNDIFQGVIFMYRLFYVSTANPGVTNETLEQITENSRKNNIEKKISGVLAFNGFNFAQVLEGEEKDVLELYETIRQDDRHSGVILISQKPVDKRVYNSWGLERSDSYDFDELVKTMAL